MRNSVCRGRWHPTGQISITETKWVTCHETDRDTGDVGVPDLGHELHDRRLEWVVWRDLYVDVVRGAMVGCVGRATKDTLEVCQVIKSVGAGLGLVYGFQRYARVRVFLNILDFLNQTAIPVCRHDDAEDSEEQQ